MRLRSTAATRRRWTPAWLIGALLVLALFAVGLGFRALYRSMKQERPSAAARIATPQIASEGRVRGPTRLHPSAVIEREMSAGQLHSYLVRLASNDFLELVVEQQGVDVAVTFLTDDDRLLTMDSPNSDRGIESILFLAEHAGDYRLELRAGGRTGPGDYRLRVKTLGPAASPDRRRAQAAAAYERGERLRRLGDEEVLSAALAEYREAVRWWHAGDDPRGAALAFHRISQVHGRLGDPEAEIEACRSAIELAETAGARRHAANLLYHAGLLDFRAGRHHQAARAFERAEEIFRALGDRERHGQVANRIAGVHAMAGDLQAALRHYRRALKIWRELGDERWQGTVLNNLGEVLLRLGQPKLARDHFHEALGFRRRAEDQRGTAITLTSLGTAHRRLENLNRARDCFVEAWILQRWLGDRSKELNTLVGLGLTEYRRGRRERAERAYRSAGELARELGDGHAEAITLLHQAEIETERGEGDRALDLLHRALPVLSRLGDRQSEASVLFAIARAERAAGRPGLARRWLELALERVESLREQSYSPSLRQTYFAFKRGYYEEYIDLLMELHRRHPREGFAALALGASERSRVRSLLETLMASRSDLLREPDPELRDRERAVLDRLIHRDLELWRLEGEKADPRRKEILAAELRRLAAELREVRSRVRLPSPHLAPVVRPQLPDLATLQRELLDPETLLIEYALGEERSFLWLVGRELFEVHELVGRERIEQLARQAHHVLTESHKQSAAGPTRLTLADLSELVLGPIADRLGTKRLVIVAEGALQIVPFAALPDPRDRHHAKPLVEDHEIVALPSAGVIGVLRSGRPRPANEPSGTLAVIADPVFRADDERLTPASGVAAPRIPLDDDAEFPRLPHTADEARAILALADGETLLALGFDAHLGLVRSGELSRYRILHFATHGRLHAEHPELSGLLLSRFDERGRPRSGLLYAYELYDLRLSAELVVLSACRTALGRQIRGEGVMNLTRGFLHAGAKRVVVSLWSVDDEATQELMRRFYRSLLREGRTPSAALRSAQASLRAEPDWRAPYYWAGFVLQGEWR